MKGNICQTGTAGYITVSLGVKVLVSGTVQTVHLTKNYTRRRTDTRKLPQKYMQTTANASNKMALL
ncbi:hypothetical protein E2C01_011920 [Portunus trituberculatus]|uniref:Uncharacterized protein n=1 Tax=Portunus trituberculatus TaxID=210409 RepID=A0A5B7DD48_PORTR|nr:hypothetical protein [Portunus trituberculatus]